MPIFVARQWIRHRTARLNEISGRYSVMRDEFYVPEADQIRPQSTTNRQGRAEDSVDPATARRVLDLLLDDQRLVFGHYESMIGDGIARELARIDLPLSLYTEWYWQIDLHNLFHFLRLRMDSHAQYEIRVYAEAMARCARAVAPLAYDAFEEHKLYAQTFSRSEMEALKALLDGRDCPIDNPRRREEFFAKLDRSDPGTDGD